MKISIHPDYQSMSSAAAAFLSARITEKPSALVTIPSGDTPTGMLDILVSDIKAGKLDISQTTFVGLDEWVGMSRFDEGSCQEYVYNKFFVPAGVRPDKIVFFDAKSNDLKGECQRVDKFIFENGPLDVVVLGVGLNGHVGLNEPGTSFENNCHVSKLDIATIQSARKYFKRETKLEYGITLGPKHFLNAKTVVVIANGEKKSSIIRQIVQGPVTESVPGSVLQRHPDCYFFLDSQASSGLAVNRSA